MAFYKYEAKDKEGKIYEKTAEAHSRYDIYALIREEGGTPVSIHEVRKINLFASFENLFGNVKADQKINFAKNLGLMMDAGLSVTRALSVMSRQSKRKAFKVLLTDIENDVSKGETLSAALGKRPKVFSALFVSMVKAGEESGNLSGSLNIVASQMEKTHLLVKKVRGALIYPGIIITVMLIIGGLLLIFMVPVMTETFEGIGAQLPLSTRILIGLSDFLIANTILVLGGLMLLVLGGIAFFKSAMGHRVVDIIVLRIPVIGEIIKEFESARTTRTLSSLLSAGVEIIAAMDTTLEVIQNHLYKKVLKKARSAVEKGEPISTVFAENSRIYPLFVGEMMAVGEETGKISEMLMNVATYYEGEVDQKTKDLSTIIEPILMIIIGIGVGFFAISMLAPTYSLVDYI